jgi:hypothetical protein
MAMSETHALQKPLLTMQLFNIHECRSQDTNYLDYDDVILKLLRITYIFQKTCTPIPLK